ncbi:hypothetical protein PWT90_09386 [Aphanocladium album]|nr:hypothetical protein PWT90_09386 [Aphanocladium album]
MLFKIISVTLLASAANAAILDLFSDNNCEHKVGERNVWDNTCAEQGELGFSSYRITTGGGFGQVISTYVQNNCAQGGPVSSCKEAYKVGECVNAIINAGSSHAISSYTFCA